MFNDYYHNQIEKKMQQEYYDNQLQNRVQMSNPGSSDSPYYPPDMHHFVHPQMNSINRNLQMPMKFIQMNPQMVDHRQAALEQENISSQMDEGYLSPAIVYVPSPIGDVIHMIPSPMPSSMIPSPSLQPINYIAPEAMDRFTLMNSGLGLVNPGILVQLPFEDMLSSLGLLPIDNTDDQRVQRRQTRSKGKNRTLYKCPWEGCEKTFTRPYNLKSHYRGHTGERPFVCSVCFAGFARKHDLKRHAKSHQVLKSFSCPFCHRYFSRSDALRRHLRNDRLGKESSCSFKQAQITRAEFETSSKD